jgi:hypothetical protein
MINGRSSFSFGRTVAKLVMHIALLTIGSRCRVLIAIGVLPAANSGPSRSPTRRISLRRAHSLIWSALFCKPIYPLHFWRSCVSLSIPVSLFLGGYRLWFRLCRPGAVVVGGFGSNTGQRGAEAGFGSLYYVALVVFWVVLITPVGVLGLFLGCSWEDSRSSLWLIHDLSFAWTAWALEWAMH